MPYPFPHPTLDTTVLPRHAKPESDRHYDYCITTPHDRAENLYLLFAVPYAGSSWGVDPLRAQLWLSVLLTSVRPSFPCFSKGLLRRPWTLIFDQWFLCPDSSSQQCWAFFCFLHLCFHCSVQSKGGCLAVSVCGWYKEMREPFFSSSLIRLQTKDHPLKLSYGRVRADKRKCCFTLQSHTSGFSLPPKT